VPRLAQDALALGGVGWAHIRCASMMSRTSVARADACDASPARRVLADARRDRLERSSGTQDEEHAVGHVSGWEGGGSDCVGRCSRGIDRAVDENDVRRPAATRVRVLELCVHRRINRSSRHGSVVPMRSPPLERDGQIVEEVNRSPAEISADRIAHVCVVAHHSMRLSVAVA